MPAPPEALLIQQARERAGLSKRAAAKKAGISDALWRRIEGGRMLERGGEHMAVRATAEKLAKMAVALGIPSSDLVAVGRADAAAAMARVRLPAEPSGGVDDLLAAVEGTPGFSRRSKRILRGVIKELAEDPDDPDEVKHA